jgi:prophage maintenance system killer protein
MNGIEIYKSADDQIEVEVKFEEDTVWLNQYQLAELFDGSRSNIAEHIKNIYKSEELDEEATCRKFRQVRQEGKRQVERQIDHYNLDVIISVGYRVNSRRGVQFRQWATKRLKDILIKGFSVNEQRLRDSEQKLQSLKESIKLLENVTRRTDLTSNEAVGLLKIVSEYSRALELLDQYDHQKLSISDTQEASIDQLTYREALDQIQKWRVHQNAGILFGNEKDQSFRSSLDTIYQTFDGVDLYPSLKEKAANLLYFIVKNHSFSDGNKRIAAGLFIYFLDKNKKLYNSDGNKVIADNTLVAITIMVAESKTEEKEIMIKLIVNLMS